MPAASLHVRLAIKAEAEALKETELRERFDKAREAAELLQGVLQDHTMLAPVGGAVIGQRGPWQGLHALHQRPQTLPDPRP